MEKIIEKLKQSVGDKFLDSTSIHINVHKNMTYYTVSRGYGGRNVYRGEDFGGFMDAIKNLKPRNPVLYRKFPKFKMEAV